VIATTGDRNCNKMSHQPELCLKWRNLYNYWAEPSKHPQHCTVHLFYCCLVRTTQKPLPPLLFRNLSNGLFTKNLFRGNSFTNSLPSNGYICNTAPFLRLLVLNSLQTYPFSFLKIPARGVFLWVVLSCGDHSPTATTAPSLSALVPSGSLLKRQ
jgi:hypothetical protein